MKILAETDGDQVFLYVDEDGREHLRNVLDRIAVGGDSGETEHHHFFSSEWGGSELLVSPTPSDEGLTPVHHVKLNMLSSDSEFWKETK